MKNNLFVLIFIFLIIVTVNLFSAPPHPRLIKEMRQQNRMPELTEKITTMQDKGMDMPSSNQISTIGTLNVCVILIGFDSGSDPITTSYPQTFFSNLLNGETSTAVSTRKFYRDMSNNTLTFNFTVYGPYNVSGTHSYYGTNEAHVGELVALAVNAADGDIDYADYDNDGDGEVEMVVVFHAGQGEEYSYVDGDIWSHKWDLDSAAYYGYGPGAQTCDLKTINTYTLQAEYLDSPGNLTIGVVTHEVGHVLGLPDLYDTYSSDGTTQGDGDWTIMASGSWNGPLNKGGVPAPLLAWERAYLGWLTLDDLTALNTSGPAKTFGYASFTLLGIVLLLSFILTFIFGRKKGIRTIFIFFMPVIIAFFVPVSFINCSDDSSSSGSESIMDIDTSFNAKKIPLGFSYSGGEQYFILENKVRKTGTWSEYLPGDGLLITHIDEYLLYYYGGSGLLASNWVNARGIHSVNIIEADGNNALWYNFDQGSSTDPYYSGNNSSLTPNTNPASTYYRWIGSSTYIPTSSTVSITNISTPGTTMTFDYSY